MYFHVFRALLNCKAIISRCVHSVIKYENLVKVVSLVKIIIRLCMYYEVFLAMLRIRLFFYTIKYLNYHNRSFWRFWYNIWEVLSLVGGSYTTPNLVFTWIRFLAPGRKFGSVSWGLENLIESGLQRSCSC